MNDRRRFLTVLGGSVLAMGATPAIEGCGGENQPGTGGGNGGNGGNGGSGGNGGTGGSEVICNPAPPGVPLGTPDKFVTPGLHKVTGTKVLLGRDAGGLFALSSLCTHSKCDLNKSAGVIQLTGIKCTCHNSTFDVQGNVTKSPATKPLPAFSLVLGCDGVLYADQTNIVDADQRLDL